MSDEPIRIVVEVVSAADVKRLEGRDEDVREEVRQLAGRVDGLHRTIYELMEAISKHRDKR